MGIQLVQTATGPRWSHLTNAERLVLVVMCITALDRENDHGDPPDLYYKGIDYLAENVLGGATAGQRKVIQRRIASLLEHGAIERMEDGHRGHRAIYRMAVRDTVTCGQLANRP